MGETKRMRSYPGRIRYNVREVLPYTNDHIVIYDVHCGRNGRTKAFRLVVEASRHSIHDMWPLRREIARHAGVDPDQVIPDWDEDVNRQMMGRLAPIGWYVLIDPDEEVPSRVKTTVTELTP